MKWLGKNDDDDDDDEGGDGDVAMKSESMR